MSYTLARVVEAERPIRVEIGGSVFHARPVSAALAMRTIAASVGVGDARLVERDVLRAAFPKPRWCWWRDPLRHPAMRDASIRSAILQRLFAIPRVPEDATHDHHAATRAWQRAATKPAASGVAPSLAIAVQACRYAFGEGWYFNPARWPTADGYAPHAVVWVEFAGLSAVTARDELVAIAAHSIANSGKEAKRAVDKVVRRAYPDDPWTHPQAFPH